MTTPLVDILQGLKAKYLRLGKIMGASYLHPEPMIRSGSRVGKSDYLQRKGFDVSSKRNFCVTKETGEHSLI
jgi:hypothetical protein